MTMNSPSTPCVRFPNARRGFLAWAAVVAMSLLAFYVHLLNASVARGERLRIERCSASTPSPAAASPPQACLS